MATLWVSPDQLSRDIPVVRGALLKSQGQMLPPVDLVNQLTPPQKEVMGDGTGALY